MRWRNEKDRYGGMAVLCHWVTAVTVVALFALGIWMTGLNYYDPWYNRGPTLHVGIGVMLAALIMWRLAWRVFNQAPEPVPGHKRWERRAAKVTHWLFYVLLFAMFATGYLIVTAEGRALDVFDWFSIPAVVTGEQIGINNMEDVAGEIHEWIAYTIIGLACVHALAALKHHFIDKDATLLRMFGNRRRG